MIAQIKFAKTKITGRIPSKSIENAGLDIYACFDEPYIKIPPHETAMIPTGIASACDTDYAFILKERGSTGTTGIAQRCGVIDSGYRGEWFVPITNTTNKDIVIAKKDHKPFPSGTIIYPYEKAICQALVVPVPILDIEEYTLDELQEIQSERGDGCLGSSRK